MSNRRDIQFLYNPHNRATLIDCDFTVASADSAGFGISNLNKSGRVSTVFMHTSVTPGVASTGQTNPNPANGLIYVTLQDNYATYLSHDNSFRAPLSGTPITIVTAASLTIGNVYTITALGTTTQANWQAVGLPVSIQAAVGVSFIASATAGVGTGTVQAPNAAGSGVDHIEVIGNPTLMNNYNGASLMHAGIGMQLILACYKNGVLTAPNNGTLIDLSIYLNNSAQGV